MLSGHEIEEGTLYPVYEFRHLTFQEYLAARAIVNGNNPDRRDSDTILSLLKPHLEDERWEEVIRLASVLAGGRRVAPLIDHLITRSMEVKLEPRGAAATSLSPANLLAECILDEVQVTPAVLRESFRWIARRSEHPFVTWPLLESKYGKTFEEVCVAEFQVAESDLLSLGSILADMLEKDPSMLETWVKGRVGSRAKELLDSDDAFECSLGCLWAVNNGWKASPLSPTRSRDDEALSWVRSSVSFLEKPLLRSEHSFEQLSVCWAYAWCLRALDSPPLRPALWERLLELWISTSSEDVRYTSAWAISNCAVERDCKPFGEGSSAIADILKERLKRGPGGTFWTLMQSKAALVVAFYIRAPWTDPELAERFVEVFGEEVSPKFLGQLGESGLKLLPKVDEITKLKTARRAAGTISIS
jgi:hypothetical protein